MSDPLTKLGDFFWVTVPARLARVSPMFGATVADGVYLARWPVVTWLAPPLLMLIGFVLGWWPFGMNTTIYTFSIGMMAFMVLASSFGGGLGWWLLIGYMLGNFILQRHVQHHPYASLIEHALLVRPPLLIAYALLANLIMTVPFAAKLLRLQVLGRFSQSNSAGVLIHAIANGLLHAAMVFAWVNAVPTLIRPVFVWTGSSPPQTAIGPLQESGWLLVILAGICGAARALLDNNLSSSPLASRRNFELREQLGSTSNTAALPRPVAMGAQALITFIMLSGIFFVFLDWLIALVGIASIVALREFLLPKLPAWGRLVNQVPIVMRLLAGMAIVWLVTNSVLPTLRFSRLLLSDSGDPLTSILITSLAGMLVFVLLMPRGSTTQGAAS